MSKSVSKEAKKGAEGAILLLENLDHEKVIAKLNNAGFRISNEEYKKILEKIIKRLKIIQTSKTAGVKYLETTQYFPDLKKGYFKK